MIESKYMFSEAKAKAKDLAFKAKAKAKDLAPKAKAMASRTPSLVRSEYSQNFSVHPYRVVQKKVIPQF